MSANNIGSLVKSLFQVNFFSPFPSVTSFLLPFSGGMSDKSAIFTLSPSGSSVF